MPTHYQGSPQARLALDTFIKLTRAVNSLENRLYAHNVIEGLTPSQFGVLEALYHLGPMCPGEVGSKLLKSGGNITLVVDNLEKMGLVRRERDTTDRRMIILHLTPEGTAVIERTFPQMLAAIQAELDVLTLEEQAELGRLCRILGRNTRE